MGCGPQGWDRAQNARKPSKLTLPVLWTGQWAKRILLPFVFVPNGCGQLTAPFETLFSHLYHGKS